MRLLAGLGLVYLIVQAIGATTGFIKGEVSWWLLGISWSSPLLLVVAYVLIPRIRFEAASRWGHPEEWAVMLYLSDDGIRDVEGSSQDLIEWRHVKSIRWRRGLLALKLESDRLIVGPTRELGVEDLNRLRELLERVRPASSRP